MKTKLKNIALEGTCNGDAAGGLPVKIVSIGDNGQRYGRNS
jgi:hypothetical protein